MPKCTDTVVDMSLYDIYIIMSWMIPEYKMVYYNSTGIFGILPDWERIRTISDVEFDRKENLYYEVASYLGYPVKPEIGVDLNRGSRKVILDKMRLPFSSKNAPLVWDANFETEYILELFAKEILKHAKKRAYKIKTRSSKQIKKKYK